MTVVDCISDLHGFFPELEGGDLLIIAGDLTKNDDESSWIKFHRWMNVNLSLYKKVVIIAGNHDNALQRGDQSFGNEKISYLCDSGTEFEGLKIYGSPWTLKFPGMNPRCMAFTVDTEEELAVKFSLIPEDMDILLNHMPPWGIMDEVDQVTKWGTKQFNVGSRSLATKVGNVSNPPKLWVWGHIHECYGIDPVIREKPCIMVNASHVNERYEPVNKPIRIVL